MRTKIYTKTGDTGMTSLVGGARVSKTDPRLDSYGTVDELNAVLGMVQAHIATAPAKHLELQGWLTRIQNRLFNLGSLLACEDEKLQSALPKITNEDIVFLERAIDTATEKLPDLKDFILPGGHFIASSLHVARTVCRRAERQTMALYEAKIVQDEILLKFLNRLSDFLFVASRLANFNEGFADVKWQKDV
jgi:cob(I)alamin adenosyltransferase